MLKSNHRRHIRRSLALTTALAGGCLIISAASAQSLPAVTDGTTVAVSGGTAAAISKSGQTLTVNLKAIGTVIEWDGFNVPDGSTVRFNDSRQVGQGLSNIAVLNRDMSNGVTNISGGLSSESNVAVWIYNPRGILIGGTAVINTGSLVLTTLEPTNFLSGNGYRLTGASNLTSGITVQAGAKMTVEGGNRGLILVAPQIESNGTLLSEDQDVAFVTATDVTLTYALGSPLSIALNKGTSVGGPSQIVRGKVTGQDVTFALASQSSVTNALLSVSAEVLTAGSTDRGIVLVAGRTAGAVGGVTVGGTTAETGGVAGVAVSGKLTTDDSDGDIVVRGTGAVTVTRALAAGKDVLITAGGLASVTGAVSAGQDYFVTGNGVTLGNASADVVQQARRNVSITANNGTLTGLGGLTLLADANGNGTGAVTLATGGTSGGNIAFGASTVLRGGSESETDVQIRVRAATNTIVLGDIEGRALLGSVGTANFTNGLSITGGLLVGDVDIDSALTLRSGAMTTGALVSGDAISLDGTGTMRIGSLDADGAVTLSGTGTTAISGGVIARGNSDSIQILRNGAVTIAGNITAGRDLTIGTTGTPAALIVAAGDISARNISLITSGAQELRGDVTARGTLGITAGTTLAILGETRAAGDTRLTATGMRLADVASTGGALAVQSGTGGVVGTTSAGARLGARDALAVTATDGALVIAQAVSQDGAVTLTGTGITATTLDAGGDVTVNGGQSNVTIGGAVTAGGAYRVTGGTVRLGASGAVTQAADGLVTINGGAGGITGLGSLTLRSNSDGGGGEALTLAIADTAPAGAINFSRTSSLLGGTSRQSDVQVRSGSADGVVKLGNVAARGLLGAVGTVAFANGLVRNTALTVGDVRLTGALLLNGAGISGGDLVSDGTVTLVSAGALTADTIDSGGNLAMTGTGTTTIGGLVQTRGSGRSITINRDGALRIGSLQASGVVSIGGSVAPASLEIGATMIGGALTATTNGAQNWTGAINAVGAVTLKGESLTTLGVRSSGGAIALTSTIGALSAGAIDGAGLTKLDSATALTAASVRGGTGVQATAGANLAITGLVDGGSGAVTVTAANGNARLAGGVTAARDYRVTAQSVVLGGTQIADGAVAIKATAGGLSGLSGLVLTANGNGSGNEALTLDTLGGGISLAGNSVLNGGTARQSNVIIHSGGGLTLGAVNARALAINDGARLTDALTTGNLSLAQGLTLLGGVGGIRTGTITLGAGNLLVDAVDGAVTTNTINAVGTVKLSGTSVNFANISGSAVTLQSVGTGATGIDGNDITASGPVTLTATVGSAGVDAGRITTTGSTGAVAINSSGTVKLSGVTASGTATITTLTNPADILIVNGLKANGTVRLTSARDIRAPFITSVNGALILLAPNGSLTGYVPGSNIQLTAGASSGLTLDVGQAVELGALTGGPISIRANSIEIDSIDVGGNSVDLVANAGDIDINGGVRGGTVSLSATGMTSIDGNIFAGGVLTLSGVEGLTTADLRGSSITLSSDGAISTGAVNATTGFDAQSGGIMSIDTLDVSGGSASVSSRGTATIGETTVSGNLAVEANGVVTLTDDVTAGGTYGVRGSSIVLGGNGVTQSAGGQMTFTATSGGISGGSGLTLLGNTAGGASAMLIDSAGKIALAGTTVDNRAGALGLRAGSGATVVLGNLSAGTIGGIATAGDGSVSATDTFQHDAAFTAGDIVARDIGIVLSAGTLGTGSIKTTGATRLASRGTISTDGITAGTIDVEAGGALSGDAYVSGGTARVAGGSILLDRLVAGGAATIASQGALRIDSASGASLAITATGDITARDTGPTLLTSTGGDLSVEGGALVRLGNVSSAGAASISGTDIDMAGTLNAARAALIKARAALTTGDVTAGGTLTLDAGGAVSAQALRATGDALVTAIGNASVASLDTGGTLTIKGGTVTLLTGRATGAALIDATGLAALGQLTAGPTLTIRASDAALTGVQRAAAVAFENRAADTTALRLGDGTANDGFRLSDAELKLVEADTLTFRQGSGALEIGTLAFDADAGRRSVDVLGTGAIAVRGVVSGSGAGRRFRIGGDATDGGMAREINVVATNDAGGRLLFDGADLELRGNRIAVGVAPGFIDALTGASFEQVVSGFVGNANSSLYNANIGGGFYDVTAPITLSANSLTVRYGEFALFQNTGAAGQSSGFVLGSATSPVSPALTLLPMSAATNAFAAFGTINGISGTSAALLGSGVVSLGNANLGTTRINGCLVGSGAGCLAAIVIQPTLQVFETTQQDVFGSVASLDVPFDPVVSGSNEELLTGLATMGPRAACEPGDTDCAAMTEETAK